AADGQLGDDARALVLRRGADCLATVGDADRQSAVSAWQSAVKPERDGAAALPPELGLASELIGALDACERVPVLRHWVASRLELDAKPADEPDPIVRRTLQLLVDEGSPLELPLLARERELRKVIESNGDLAMDPEPDSWEGPVGTMISLLRKDVVDEEHPGRRALAIRICAPHILEAAD